MKMEISTVNWSLVMGRAWRAPPWMGDTLALLHSQRPVDGRGLEFTGQLKRLWKSEVDKNDCTCFMGFTQNAAVSIKLGLFLGVGGHRHSASSTEADP